MRCHPPQLLVRWQSRVRTLALSSYSQRVRKLVRIGLLIGALERGGSERQLAELAVGLAARGHQVEVVAYTGPGALDRYVEDRSVPVRRLSGGSKLAKLRAVRRWMQSFDPEIIHGFMKRASSLALLANVPRTQARLVASDFSTASYSWHKPVLWVALALFARADAVATQTEMNRKNLARLAPWLRRKTRVVRNGVNVDRFKPVARSEPASTFRFTCVGTVYSAKNPVRVIEAVRLLRDRGARSFRVDWFGRLGLGGNGSVSHDYRQAIALVQQHRLNDTVTFHGEVARIEDAYHSADALIHTSLQEGIPNAVVEAMACGLPTIMSRVSDLPLIVAEGHNGFVCDERNPESIADAMERMLRLPEPEREGMRVRSRELAVRWFGMKRFVEDYERLYRSLLADSRS